jgi:flagellar biosynthesis/type III secretory pathway chaperone
MVLNDNATLTETLKEMISHCQTMNNLLKNDQEHYIKDEFDVITGSNQKKIACLTQLSGLINELQVIYPNGFVEQITHSGNDRVISDEIKVLIQQLHEEVKHCFHRLSINNELVVSTLQLVQDTWEQLVAAKSESHVYDKVGNRVIENKR